ncbi:P1 family peptidase [soil metagenome]
MTHSLRSNTVAGVQIGHWTSKTIPTGCTVLLFDALSPAYVDVRGGAPGTRETDLLAFGRTVKAVDAILLSGGSAFGLAAADGIMTFLAEQKRGYATSVLPVPIVAAAVIFDIRSESDERPSALSGYEAVSQALPMPEQFAGRVGAGAGATFQKLWGPTHVRPGGIGIATVHTPHGAVSAVVVLNASGASTQQHPIGLAHDQPVLSRVDLLSRRQSIGNRESTTIGAIVVQGPSDDTLLERCAVGAHDGLARMIVPSHTVHDGDLFFAVGPQPASPDRSAYLSLPVAAELAVEQAIANVVALPL